MTQPSTGPSTSAENLLDERVELKMSDEKFDLEKNSGAKGVAPDLIHESTNSIFVRRREEVATIYKKDAAGGYIKLPHIPARSDGTILVSPSCKSTLDKLESSLPWEWTGREKLYPNEAWRTETRSVPIRDVEDLQHVIGTQQYRLLTNNNVISYMLSMDPDFFRSRDTFIEALRDVRGAMKEYDDYDTYFGFGRHPLNPTDNKFIEAETNGKKWHNELALKGVDIGDLFVCEDTSLLQSIACTSDGVRVFILDWSDRNEEKWSVKELNLGETNVEQNPVTGIGLDPNGHFIYVARGRTLSIIDHKTDPPIEVGKINHPNSRFQFEGHISSNGAGKIRVGDSNGHLWTIDSNDHLIDGNANRRQLVEGVKGLQDIRREKGKTTAAVKTALSVEIAAGQDHILTQFKDDITQASTFRDIRELRQEVSAFKKDTLMPQLNDQRLVDTAVEKVNEAINQREEDIAQEQADELYLEFESQIQRVATFEESEAIKADLEVRVTQICQDVSDKNLWAIVRSTAINELNEKETKIGVKAIQKEQKAIRDALSTIDTLDIPTLVKLRSKAEELERRAQSADLKPKERADITALVGEFATKSLEILREDEDKILGGLDGVVTDLKVKFDQVKTPAQFDRWINSDLAICRDQLTNYQLVIPTAHTRVRARILEILKELSTFVQNAREKFESQYSQTRSAVVQHTKEKIDMVSGQIDELLQLVEEKVNRKEFKDGADLENWIDNHVVTGTIEKLLGDIESKLPDEAKVLRRKLKTGLSQLTFRMERLNEMVTDAKTGAQMYPFGKVLFPILETKIHKKETNVPATRASISIKPIGSVSGRAPNDMCELVIKMTDSKGKTTEIPLYADDLRKYGLLKEDYAGQFPSYITVAQARQIVNKVNQVESGKGPLYAQLKQFQNDLKDLGAQLKPLLDQRRSGDASVDSQIESIKAQRKELLDQYMTFINDNGLYAWYKMKAVQSRTHKADLENKNGNSQGTVPDWQWYWVIDKSTENGLEDFARESARQLRLRSGIVSLEGHPGAGKDVIVDMFCNKTKRPKFTFDCSRWSTEYDLSESVQFQSKGGATQTVLLPSIVIDAIKVPNAVLYFNEFNALPLQTQIYLHSLFDAKRQITLKTSKETVPAAEGVLICSSLNPNYPGTNTPQAATRDRMVVVPVGYPEFERKDANNRIVGYEAYEALRVARSTKSLEDLTESQDLKKNDFVQLWEEYINKGQTSDPRLTSERQYDMDVIFALIQFTNEIRTAFIKKIEGTASGPNDFELSQPFTGRGLRICADYISHDLDAKNKTIGDPEYISPETMAKSLLRRYYYPYIIDGEEKKKFIQKLDSEWTVKKP